MMKNLWMGIVFTAVATSAHAGNESLSGKGAVILASVLNEIGVLSQAKWGLKPAPTDTARFFAGVFDGKQCANDAFKALDVKLQAGLIRCKVNPAMIWDSNCIVQSRAGKTITETGKNAFILNELLREAKAASTPAPDGGTTTSVSSVECIFKGWEVCSGKATCMFP